MKDLIYITSDKPKVIRKINNNNDKAKQSKENKPKRLDIITVNGQKRVVIRQD